MEQAREDQVVQEAAEAQETEVIEEEVLAALGLFQGPEEGPEEVLKNLVEPHRSLRRQDSSRRSP